MPRSRGSFGGLAASWYVCLFVCPLMGDRVGELVDGYGFAVVSFGGRLE